MSELWEPIEGFPGYHINTFGTVIKETSITPLTWTLVQNGIPTVGLVRDGRFYRRAVPLLVAKTFLPSPEREDFTTPIHLDANRCNCNVENLMWRPRWFAVAFHKERKLKPFPKWKAPLEIIETEEIFQNPFTCSLQYGVLEWDIYHSIFNKRPIFPYRFNARIFKQLY